MFDYGDILTKVNVNARWGKREGETGNLTQELHTILSNFIAALLSMPEDGCQFALKLLLASILSYLISEFIFR